MKKSLLMGAAALMLACTTSNAVQAQGIPVIDTTAIAKHIEQIAKQVEQINQLKSQLDEAKKLYDSMNQITNVKDLAGLLKDDEILKALPDQFGDLQSSLSDLTDGFAQQYDHHDTSSNAANNFYYQELDRQKKETYTDLSIGEKVYETAVKRIDALEKLRDAVGQAGTQKEILDLGARINAEMALLQNDQIRMQGLAMVQASRDRIDDQRETEERAKFLDDFAARSTGQ